MDLRKLPPAMVLTLGLTNCTQSSTCLSYDPTSADTEANPATGTAGTAGTSGSTGEFDVGPCLGQVEPETSTTSTGGSDSGTSSDGTGTDGSGSDSGSDGSGTAGALDQPPSPEHARAVALRRVLSRGILPADVAASLRGRDRED